jgi:hypothetical protein
MGHILNIERPLAGFGDRSVSDLDPCTSPTAGGSVVRFRM